MMIHQVYLAGIYIYEALILRAAAGKLLLYDDTPMRVLDLKKILRGKLSKAKRKATQTTVILSKTDDSRTIVLYFIGAAIAGENLEWILSHRPAELEALHLMCDASSHNHAPSADPSKISYCLDHFRRYFIEIEKLGCRRASLITDLLGEVYVVDAIAKLYKLDDEERLSLHQKKSTSKMAQIKEELDQLADPAVLDETEKLA